MLLAQLNNPSLSDFSFAPLLEDTGIPVAVMGILVVFSALVLVVIFISVLPRVLAFFSALDTQEAARLAVPEEDELPEQILVVIAAAVAQAFDRPHRIVRIRGLTSADLGWSLEGRMQHHQSHRIQPRARQ